MMGVGGENPWEVGVDQNVVKGQDALETEISDSTKSSGKDGGGD